MKDRPGAQRPKALSRVVQNGCCSKAHHGFSHSQDVPAALPRSRVLSAELRRTGQWRPPASPRELALAMMFVAVLT